MEVYVENSILSRVERTAERLGYKTAYRDVDGSVTFGEIIEKARRLGSALAEKARPRSAVAVMMGRHVLTPVAFLGIVYAGCFYAPVDPSWPKARLADIVSVLRPDIILADRENMELARGLVLERGRVFCTDDLFRHNIDDHSLQEIARGICLDDPLYVIFTSGSTGRPKGVITSSQALMCYIDAYIDVMGIDEGDVLGNQSPLDYIAAVRDIYIPLFTGASMSILPRQCFVMPAGLFDMLDEHRITAVGWSVSAFVIAVRSGAFEKSRPQFLKKICFSGSVMPCSILRVWQENLPEARFVNQYGPTECTASCTYYEVREKVCDMDTLPIGKPYANYRVFLLREDDTLAREGEIGEICVAGPILALGYYNDRELTSRAFIQDPLNRSYNELIYRTGDYGMLRKDGNLEFKGRKDRQIKHLGHRVELDEIESAALGLESIDGACALYHKEKEHIYLFYTGRATVKETAVFLRKLLPGFMVPRKLVWLEDMPRLPNGKTDIRTLEKKIGDHDERKTIGDL